MGNAYSTDRLGNLFFCRDCIIGMPFRFLFCPQQESKPVAKAGFSIQTDTQAVIKVRGNHVRFLFRFHAPSTHIGGHHPHFVQRIYHRAQLHRGSTCTAVVNNRCDEVFHHVKINKDFSWTFPSMSQKTLVLQLCKINMATSVFRLSSFMCGSFILSLY